MFASPLEIFADSHQNDTPSFEAMAKRSAAAATEATSVKEMAVHSYADIDVEKFSVKQRGRKGDDPFFYASYDHSQLVVNLTPKNWMRIPFAIDTLREQEEGKMQAIVLSVEISDEVSKVIQARESVAKEQVAAVVPGVAWHSSVHISDNKYADRFKAKIVIKSDNEKHLSVCTARPFGKQPVKGVGEELLIPLLKENRGFRDAKVKLAVALHRVWTMKDKFGKQMAGVTWRVTHFMADLPEQTSFCYQDVFADEAFDEQE